MKGRTTMPEPNDNLPAAAAGSQPCEDRDPLFGTRDVNGYLIGEFGFPIEGPEWEQACDEALTGLADLVRKIKSGEALPPPSPEIDLLLSKALAQQQGDRPRPAAGKERDAGTE